MRRTAALLFLSIIVAACASETPQPTGAPRATAAPRSPGATMSPFPTLSPTRTPSPSPTPTPMPAPTLEPTPEPTAKPQPTPKPTNVPTQPPTSAPTPKPTLAQLVGQKLVVRMAGTTPSADLLSRIGSGKIGGVILFGTNVTSQAQVIALTSALQQAARNGGQPHLLICTDQEGGTVKRIPWAPPTISVPDMGALGSVATAREQGVETGEALLALGINCDLAPVADVPASTSSFMYQDGRTWSFSADTTTALADAFARGLEVAGVFPAMKHFPGLGFATQNTDTTAVDITATRAQLAPGLEPYGPAIAVPIPMIMLSNATYDAYDPNNGAGWSHAISDTLLRGQLGFRGVTITDSLTGDAKARGTTDTALALKASIAGTDMILVTDSEAATSAIFDALLAAARAGTIPKATLDASYDRILGMKRL